MVNLLALQMTSQPDIETNLNFVEGQLSSLSNKQNSLVVLPECFARFGTRDRELLDAAELRYQGPIQDRLKKLAKKHRCWIVSGTLPLKAEESADRFTASSLLIGPDGDVLAEYKKIHMFDVAVKDNTGSYKESKYTQPGEDVVVVDTELGRIGMAVCYDVRFPGLFEAMGNIDILTLPAAFTRYTGQAHWHTLVRARAIEKQCFVVAANQTGRHANERETFGHSVIYSPWGDLLAEKADQPGLVDAQVEISERQALQTDMPVSQHNRFRSNFVK